MQDVENRNNVQFDPQLGQDLSGIVQNAQMALTQPEFGVVGRQVQNLLSTVQPGAQISGQSYGNLIHKGSPLDAMMNSSNSNLANYGGQIREALRNSLQRSLSPDDMAAYQGARAQWKNMKTVEPLTLRADVVGGATPSTGDINPALLRGAVNRSFPNAAYAEPGQIPLNDLANIGQRFLKETPTSQTAERSNVFRWLERGGAVAGGLLGGEHYLGVPVGEMMVPAAAAGAATLGLGRIAGKVLGSEALANRMIQRGMGTAPQGPSVMQRGVPLMTSAGIRQLSPPAGQETSRNPQTGLPEYSLRANQEAAASQQQAPAMQSVGAVQPSGGATDVASKLLDGSLTTHAATQEWINANKDGLRQRFGGQGLQNIARVAALMRKAGDANAPPTVMATLMNGAPPQPVQDAFRNAGVRTPEDLVSLAVTSPGLAKELSAKGALRVPRLTAAIQGALN